MSAYSPAPNKERLGDIVAAYQAAPDLMVLLGWSAEEIAPQGAVALMRRKSARGRFSAASWADKSHGRRWFLLCAQAPGIGAINAGDGFQLLPSGGAAATVAQVPAISPDAAAFVALMTRSLGAGLPSAAQFLVEACSAMVDGELPGVRALTLTATLAAAEESGVIEIVGRADANTLLLQGWVRAPDGIEPRIVDGAGLREFGAIFASFDRSDVGAPAQGFVALVRMSEGGAFRLPPHFFIRSPSRYHRLTLLPNVTQLRDEDVPQHLTAIVGKLRCDAAGQRAFRAAARPRFTGQDTVSSLPLPVRLAIDITSRMPGAGWYVTGWLLDPTGLVSAVSLRGAQGMSERLDASWTRLPRPDVSEGFRNDPLFAGRIGDDMHGFAVFVPSTEDETAVWLELDLGARGCAFMPLAATAVNGLEDRKKLLASVDLHKPSAGEIIERQLGPLFHAAAAMPAREKRFRVMRTASGEARSVVIVPIVDADTRSNVVVAHLANCRMPADARLVFVCSPVAVDAVRRIGRDLDFYGLSADVVLTADPVDACGALETGVAATEAPRLAFLSPRVHAIRNNWLAPLLDRLGDGAVPSVVSPTLLYEDGSVRYAGIDSVSFSDSPPYASAVCGRAGYPRAALPAGEGAATLVAAIECCALTRSAFETVGGFSAGFALDRLKSVDFFLRLSAAGVRTSWVAGIELYALDDLSAATPHWAAVGGLVDGWSFRAQWQARLSSSPHHQTVAPAAPIVAMPSAVRAKLRAAAS